MAEAAMEQGCWIVVYNVPTPRGSYPRYLTEDVRSGWKWTHDLEEAHRFATLEDAQRLCQNRDRMHVEAAA